MNGWDNLPVDPSQLWTFNEVHEKTRPEIRRKGGICEKHGNMWHVYFPLGTMCFVRGIGPNFEWSFILPNNLEVVSSNEVLQIPVIE